MSKNNNTGILSGLSEISDIPLDIAGGKPLFHLYSDRELIIECVKNIELYDDKCVRIRACNIKVTICGSGLNICFLTNRNMSVRGYIASISFEHL